jgi:DNA-binding MarR family transcriptional regulator
LVATATISPYNKLMNKQLMQLIAEIYTSYQQNLESALVAELNIDLTEYNLLKNLQILSDRNNRSAVKQELLVPLMQVDKSTVSRRLTPLISKGVVYRRDNPDSKREKLVNITEKGRATVTQAEQVEQKLTEKTFSGFDVYAQKQLQINLLAVKQRLG